MMRHYEIRPTAVEFGLESFVLEGLNRGGMAVRHEARYDIPRPELSDMLRAGRPVTVTYEDNVIVRIR